MKLVKKILFFILSLFYLWLIWFFQVFAECDGIQLNTKVPFINWWSWCIPRDKAWESFPELMWWLTKLILTFVIMASFILIIVWWVMYASWWMYQWWPEQWKRMIKKVIVWLILLWLSWIILHIINPSFFK